MFIKKTLFCFINNFSKILHKHSYWFFIWFTSLITLLPIDNPHADAVVIGITIRPIPVRDKVIELDVVTILTNVSIDFNVVVEVFFIYLF